MLRVNCDNDSNHEGQEEKVVASVVSQMPNLFSKFVPNQNKDSMVVRTKADVIPGKPKFEFNPAAAAPILNSKGNKDSLNSNISPVVFKGKPAAGKTNDSPVNNINVLDADGKLKQKLDTIDAIRNDLHKLVGNDNSFYEKLISALPNFIVCGPQSSGKSSVIRRISGIKLPESATLCTRVPTLIQMRRAPSSKTTLINVRLIGPDGKTLQEEKGLKDTQKASAVINFFQNLIIERFPSKTFVDTHNITLDVCGADVPNVTLIDLPGFTNRSDDDAVIVNKMVERYIKMEGTLTLHVIRGDQDYDTCIGNDFMRKQNLSDRITVLTHCDKISSLGGLEQSAEQGRLVSTLNDTLKYSSATYAILGNIENSEKEKEQFQLRNLASIDLRLEIGIDSLVQCIEEKMLLHLGNQLPKAYDVLLEARKKTEARLDLIQERKPMEIIHLLVQELKENYQQEKDRYFDCVRKHLETFYFDIKNFFITQVAPGDRSRSMGNDDLEDVLDDLEIGNYCYLKIQPTNEFVSRVTVTGFEIDSENIADTKISWRKDEAKTGVTPLKDCFFSFNPNIIIKDIQALTKTRSFRNVAHVDRQFIIEKYASDFADHYLSKMNATLAVLVEEDKKFYQSIFSSPDNAASCFNEDLEINKRLMPVIKALKKALKSHRSLMKEKLKDTITMLYEHNTENNLVFTTNEHYLNNLTQKMIQHDKTSASTDLGGARMIYHSVRAFIKTQKKYVTEVFSREAVRNLINTREKEFLGLLDLGSGKCFDIELMKENPKVKNERAMLMKRLDILKSSERKFLEIRSEVKIESGHSIDSISDSDSESDSD